jgi:hypothetical protein
VFISPTSKACKKQNLRTKVGRNVFEFHCGNLFTNTVADEVKEKAVAEALEV